VTRLMGELGSVVVGRWRRRRRRRLPERPVVSLRAAVVRSALVRLRTAALVRTALRRWVEVWLSPRRRASKVYDAPSPVPATSLSTLYPNTKIVVERNRALFYAA